MEHARDGGGLPTTGFPRVSGMETSDNSNTVQTQASHTTCIRSRKVVSAVIPLKRAFSERFEFIEGSSGSHDGSGSSGSRLKTNLMNPIPSTVESSGT